MKAIADSYTSRIKHTDEDSGISSLVPVLNETYAISVDIIKPMEQTSGKQYVLLLSLLFKNLFNY
jgi:hypothetical protein